jgi:hypothetical protein
MLSAMMCCPLPPPGRRQPACSQGEANIQYCNILAGRGQYHIGGRRQEFKRGFRVGASRLHLVPTPCPHTLSKAKDGAAEAQKTRPIVLVLVLVLERAGTAGTADGYRQVSTGDDDCTPKVARTFLSARGCAGRQECLPHKSKIIRAPVASRLQHSTHKMYHCRKVRACVTIAAC